MRFSIQLVVGTCLAALLAGCASRVPAPASSKKAGAPQPSSQQFEDIARQLHSPKLMARVLLEQAKQRKDPKQAILASYFALRAHADPLAGQAAELARKLDPGSAVPHQLMLRIALDNGNIAVARKQASAAFDAGGASAVAPVLQGSIDPWLAYAVVRPLAAAHGDDAAVQLLLARAALQAGDNTTALKAANKAGGSLGAEAAQFVRIQALWGLGHRKQALKDGFQVLASHPHSIGFRAFMGGLLTHAGKYARAREVLNDASALAPGNEHVVLAYAMLDAAEGKAGAARRRLTVLLEQGSRSAGAYHLLARLAAKDRDWGQAFGWYSAINDGDFLGSSGVAAAYALVHWKGLGTARAYLAHLSDVAPALTPTWLGAEAGLVRQSGKPRKAYVLVTRAAKQYPVVRPLRYQRALLADTLGKSGIALGLLRKLVAEQPGNAEYLNAYGYTLTEHTHRYREAYRYIKRALAADPENGAILDSMGWVLYRLGKPSKAVGYLRRAWKRTGDSDVAEHLVRVCLALGHTKEATRVLDAALTRSPKNAALQRLKKRLAQ